MLSITVIRKDLLIYLLDPDSSVIILVPYSIIKIFHNLSFFFSFCKELFLKVWPTVNISTNWKYIIFLHFSYKIIVYLRRFVG